MSHLDSLIVDLHNAGLDTPVETWSDEQWAAHDLRRKMEELTEGDADAEDTESHPSEPPAR